MSKMITKKIKLYINDDALSDIKEKTFTNIAFNKLKSASFQNEIEISWQELEKKIEITESEFQEKLRKSVPINWTNELIENISKRFFGASDE